MTPDRAVPLVDEFAEWSARVMEVARGHAVLLRCPVRNREFVDGPEERIRQGLLHFLIDLAREVEVELGAERERHDIDLRWPTHPSLRPSLAPLLIIETKVDHVAGDWTNTQLGRYLGETGGDCGVVFTGRRMWRLSVASSGTQSMVTLDSLGDLAALVRERAATDPLAPARDDFRLACEGEIGALRRLAARYRYATFVLAVGGVELACRHLRFEPDGIAYRPAGRHMHRPLTMKTQDLERLVRIEP